MKNNFFSIWLSLIIIIIFIFQLIIPGFTEMFILNQASYFQIWRFLTSIFLHSNLGHLVYNLFALLLFGLILEKFIGSKNFLFVFFISGILSNVFSVNFYISSLGASGAIFGIIGCLTLIKPLMPVWAFGLIIPMFVASILWVTGDLLGFLYASDNIGHLAHLSGIFIGILFGIFLKNKITTIKKRKEKSKIHIPEKNIRFWEEEFMKN